MKKPTQQTRAIKRSGPQGQAIELQKSKFLEALVSNGGNVSNALLSSSLARKTAYRHFNEDEKFADAWLEALDVATDELLSEARRRGGKQGVQKPVFQNGKRVGSVREHSDTLLIFLIKHSEGQRKWRNRIIQTANMALATVQRRGATIGLTAEQIEDLQLAMTEDFTSINLL